uniref:Uncharacterized protein n=1 Tax=Panagrolaimus sp. ES5 TaxID=591445 RepID=A0AC34G593_9BILA
MFKAKGINAELRRELNIQCQTEELSKLMIEYDISLCYLYRSFDRTSVMELLARAFYASKKPLPEKMEQLTRMARLFEIISQKDMEIEYTVAQAVDIAANIYIKNYEIAPIKEAFAIMKSDYCRKSAAETLIAMCISALEFCDPSLAETRLAAIDACSIIARLYLPLTPSVKRTLDIVNRLLQLQKSYGTMIPYSELTSRKKEVAEERLLEYCTV